MKRIWTTSLAAAAAVTFGAITTAALLACGSDSSSNDDGSMADRDASADGNGGSKGGDGGPGSDGSPSGSKDGAPGEGDDGDGGNGSGSDGGVPTMLDGEAPPPDAGPLPGPDGGYVCAPPTAAPATPALGGGTRFYVSNSGSDSADGMTTGTAWATVAKVNAALGAGSVGSGDSVLFARGGTWREQLTLPPNEAALTGTAASPVTFADYGTGALPILSGADPLTTWAAVSASSSNYLTNAGTQAAWLFTDTSGTTYADSSGKNNALTVTTKTASTSDPTGFSGGSASLVTSATLAASAMSSALPGHASAANFTIGGWVNLSALGSFKSFFDLGDSSHGIHLLTDPGGRFYPVVCTTSGKCIQGSIFPVMTANRWTHVVIRATGTSNLLEVFFDGVKQFVDTLALPNGTMSAAPTANLQFGAGGDTGLFFQWFMANSAFSDGDIESVYADGLASKTITAYSTPLATPAGGTAPDQVFADGARLKSFPQLAGLPAGAYFYDGSSTLSVRTPADMSPTGHSLIEVSTRPYVVNVACTSHSFLDFSNLQLQMSSNVGFYSCGGTSFTLAGLTVTDNFGQGIRIDGGTAHHVYTTLADFNGNDGIAFYKTPDLVVSHSVAHDNILFENQFASGIKVEPDHAPGVANVGASSTNTLIDSCTSYNNGVGLQTLFTGSGVWIDTAGDGAILRDNVVFANNDMGVNIDASNHTTAICNTSHDNLIGGIGAYADGQPSMTGHLLIGNTVYDNSGFGIQISGPVGGAMAGGCVGNTVQSNLATGTLGENFQALTGCENPGTDGSGNVVTYDDFGKEAAGFLAWGNGAAFSTYASWEEAPGNCGSAGCSHCGD